MKHESDPQESSSARGRLTVVCSEGIRQRFLRGMITHHLVQRGLSFEHSYAIARQVRDALSDRDEVTTAEIRALVQERLENALKPEELSSLSSSPRRSIRLMVEIGGESQPFSRGLLARSISAAGISLDRAYFLVKELENALQQEKFEIIPKSDLIRRVAELLERLEGSEVARRFRLVRRLNRLPKPLIIYLGGASGTGKSTLALELAPLLRIYRINATDTIRQVMRMIFSPSMLPALHSSSFELPMGFEPLNIDEPTSPPSAKELEQQRLLATFDEQATRVCVGVRAVVERAIKENMSILVEGIHLVPGRVPFPDLEGAAYQVPLLLATLNEETHRSRFLNRSRLGGRRAERYVESFSAIRGLHEHLLLLSEIHDIPLLDTSEGEPPVAEAVRLVTDLLASQVPALARPSGLDDEPALVPTLLLVIDGLADRPVRTLGGRTPLQAAKTPTLDRLAKEGSCGLADTISPGVVPDTAAGTLALFGQSPVAMKRGPVEALGAGVKLSRGDIALRANLATMDGKGQVIDRRAGRIRSDAARLARALDRAELPGSLAEEVEVRVRPATEHRLAIVLKGMGLSSAIQGSDPGDGAIPCPALTPQPQDPGDETAVYTARVLALFEQEAQRILGQHPVNRKRREEGLPEANIVLSRGAGRLHDLIPLESAGIPLRLACISGDRTILGIARWLGAETISEKGMTANLDTDLELKFTTARKALAKKDLVMLHLKGADIAAHDQRPDLKAEFLERVDQHLAKMLKKTTGPLRVVVASDHATLSESGQHSADPLPVLIWGEGIEADHIEAYDETAVAGGRLQRFPLQLLLSRLYKLT